MRVSFNGTTDDTLLQTRLMMVDKQTITCKINTPSYKLLLTSHNDQCLYA